MESFPSNWAITKVGYGEGKKHLYPVGDMMFFADRDAAMARAEKWIASEPDTIVALLNVYDLFRAKPILIEPVRQIGPGCSNVGAR